MDPCLQASHIITQHLRLLQMPAIARVKPQPIVAINSLQRLMDQHVPRLSDWRVELTLGHDDLAAFISLAPAVPDQTSRNWRRIAHHFDVILESSTHTAACPYPIVCSPSTSQEQIAA